MKRAAIGLVFILCPAFLAAANSAESSTDNKKEGLKVGAKAPDFKLKGSDGKTYKLSDFKGKRGVVVAWFPKAFTSG